MTGAQLALVTLDGDLVAPASTLNASGSPTGRVTGDASPASVSAAIAVRAPAHREILADALRSRPLLGLTSIEAAALLPPTRQGGPQVSNRSASRLGELWEDGRATVLRERGVCVLGSCHPHDKPDTVHRPSARCEIHGRPRTRGGAAVWVRT